MATNSISPSLLGIRRNEHHEQLLRWLATSPEPREGLLMSNIEQGVRDTPSICLVGTPFRIMRETLRSTFTLVGIGSEKVKGSIRYRLPCEQEVDEMIRRYNNDQYRKSNIFQACHPRLVLRPNRTHKIIRVGLDEIGLRIEG